MSTYPRDEFDEIPEDAERQGIHRSPAANRALTLRPILVAGVLALVVGLICFFALPGQGARKADATKPAATASVKPGASQAPKPGTTTAPVAPVAPKPPAEAVKKETAVAVYNATTTAGLAGRISTALQGAGWKTPTVGNWAGNPVQSSVVYYNAEALKATAEQLAKDAGITTATLATDLKDPLAVVAGPGYK